MALTDRRIQIYFPERQYRAIKARAHAEGKSIGMLMREAVARYLTGAAGGPSREGYAALLGGAGACRDTESDVAERHDEHLGQGPW